MFVSSLMTVFQRKPYAPSNMHYQHLEESFLFGYKLDSKRYDDYFQNIRGYDYDRLRHFLQRNKDSFSNASNENSGSKEPCPIEDFIC